MTSVQQTTIRIIAEKAELDPAELKPETPLGQLDIQSLELAEIIFDLEDEFDIEIELDTATAWEQLKTVSDVAETVAKLVSEST